MRGVYVKRRFVGTHWCIFSQICWGQRSGDQFEVVKSQKVRKSSLFDEKKHVCSPVILLVLILVTHHIFCANFHGDSKIITQLFETKLFFFLCCQHLAKPAFNESKFVSLSESHWFTLLQWLQRVGDHAAVRTSSGRRMTRGVNKQGGGKKCQDFIYQWKLQASYKGHDGTQNPGTSRVNKYITCASIALTYSLLYTHAGMWHT